MEVKLHFILHKGRVKITAYRRWGHLLPAWNAVLPAKTKMPNRYGKASTPRVLGLPV